MKGFSVILSNLLCFSEITDALQRYKVCKKRANRVNYLQEVTLAQVCDSTVSNG